MEEPKSLKIRNFLDVKVKLQQFPDLWLADFFLLYESLNQKCSKEKILQILENFISVMEQSVENYKNNLNQTPSKMVQGGAFLVGQGIQQGCSLLDEDFSRIIQNTLAVSEGNACMGRIVAAPTAGACGVLPGAFLSIAKKHKKNIPEITNSLLVAGGIGEVISLQASLSGSTHGCQAETGSASAMTAAAIASLFTRDINTIESAACFALKNMLGLACDPVAGLVEVPCIKRNVMASVNAIACAEMALCGIKTVLPLDEIIDAMKRIGNSLPYTLKETSLGGLAICPEAKKINRRLYEKMRMHRDE